MIPKKAIITINIDKYLNSYSREYLNREFDTDEERSNNLKQWIIDDLHFDYPNCFDIEIE